MTRFFTFYTENTPYEEEAKLTVEAFAKFDVACEAIAYINQHDWMMNAKARSGLLMDIAAKYPYDNIGMVDADCRPVRKPVRMIFFNGDFGCEDRGPSKKSNLRFSAGSLVFGASTAGRGILSLWTTYCTQDAQPKMPLREQYYLFQAVVESQKNPDFHFVNLGNEYNRKPEDVKPGDDTVMIHDVASRRYLKKIGGRR